jgi:hypothetical protein
MDVIGFLCVSPGSSTVQLHESLGNRRACACSETGFSSQNGNRAWGCTPEEESSVVRFFCGQKDSMQGIFMYEYFLFMLGSVCLVKRSTTGWQTLHWWRRGWNGDEEVAETTVKRLLCCKFLRQVYRCWWGICREINAFFFRFQYHMFYVLYLFVIYLLPLPRTSIRQRSFPSKSFPVHQLSYNSTQISRLSTATVRVWCEVIADMWWTCQYGGQSPKYFCFPCQFSFHGFFPTFTNHPTMQSRHWKRR